jgi:hypothetical protein
MPETPETVEIPSDGGMRLRSEASAVAADGGRALVLQADRYNEQFHVTYWEQSTGSRRSLSRCSQDQQEPALAGPTAAFVCWWTADGPHRLLLYVWRPHEGRKAELVAVAPIGNQSHHLNLQGDGSLLVFNTGRLYEGRFRPTRLWRVAGSGRKLILEGPAAGPIVDVEHGSIAIGRSRVVDVRSRDGALVRRLAIGAGPTQGIQVTDTRLIVLRGHKLDAYSLHTGRRIDTHAIDPGGLAPARLLDAEGDFAVYVAGVAIHLVRLTDGKDLALAIADQADTAGADLEPAGLFYAYNQYFTARPGRIAFLSTGHLRRAFDQTSSADMELELTGLLDTSPKSRFRSRVAACCRGRAAAVT